MNFVNSNGNFAKEIHLQSSGYVLLTRRMLGLHGETEAAAHLWSQFLLEVKGSVHLVGRALSNFIVLEQ